MNNFIAPITHVCDFNEVSLWIKRDDLMHPKVSGNKAFKLKFNIAFAQEQGLETLLTFGGAFSNHIAATAAIGKMTDMKTIGIIRGERLKDLNPTLAYAKEQGMTLEFISRSAYREKTDRTFLSALRERYGNIHIIPEGGANALGIQGAEEMLNSGTQEFDHIVCAIGTGTTVAGLLQGAKDHQRVIGIPVHKHTSIMSDVFKEFSISTSLNEKLDVWDDFHFGGYAKWNIELIEFIRSFKAAHGIQLDPIYTGKAMHGVMKKIGEGYFKAGSKILFMHTGGLQGISGFEQQTGIKLED